MKTSTLVELERIRKAIYEIEKQKPDDEATQRLLTELAGQMQRIAGEAVDVFKTQGSVKERAAQMALRTSDAYSANRYLNWMQVAKMLYEQKLNDQQVEAVLRSKWARYAADQSPYRLARSWDLKRYMDQNKLWGEQVRRLTVELV